MASQLIGDDYGIVLISTRKSLAKLRESQGQEPDKEAALLSAMNSGQLIAVGTKGGGTIQTVVQCTGREEAEKTTRAISQFGWTVFPQAQIEVADRDEVLVLPYSLYSRYRLGDTEISCADDECWSFAADSGLYDVYFGHLLEPEDLDADGGARADRSVWFLLVKSDFQRELSLDNIPGYLAD